MPSPRGPWWLFVVAVSFLAFFIFATYCRFWEPEPEGFQYESRHGHLVVLEVTANSPAAKAGLEAGDRIVSVNGQALRTPQDWFSFRSNIEINRPLQLEIERESRKLNTILMLKQRGWTYLTLTGRVRLLGWTAAQLLTLVLAFVIACSRPRDAVALLGAWLLAIAAIFDLDLPRGRMVVWRHLPMPLSVLLWMPYLSLAVTGSIVFAFFASFPRKLFPAFWPWVLVWVPSLFGVPDFVLRTYRVIYQPERIVVLSDWVSRTRFLVMAVSLVGAFCILIVNYRSLHDINERRRVRVLVLGTTSAILAILPFFVLGAARGFLAGNLPAIFRSLPAQMLSLLLFLAFPLSFAYAILHHRLFDIRVMIRKGLQYALARGVMLSLVPGLGVLLLTDLVLHSDQPLIAILRGRGWIYGVLGGLALLAHWRRKHWLEALDRRFFREHYDAQKLLREIAEGVREASSFEHVAPRVVARIGVALHPEFVALLVRNPRESTYRSVAAAPAGQAPPPILAESKLASLIRVLGKPLDVSSAESKWLGQQLPPGEADSIRQARVELLIPVAMVPERREALLALGSKRSEEPYNQEDRNVLVAIACSLAILIERPAATPVRLSDAFEECPECGACYDTGSEHCAHDGATLALVALPRALAGRYQLNRRRGRGGMGTVYEAVDTALDRRVAVKVIRDDLMGSAVAAERFRQEARAAASFAHPNVVTVYDFGVAANMRAFLVMELLEGVTLREELRIHVRLTAPRTLEILRCVCAALDAAHRRQLIHRDLKPENVFLARAETGESPKVLDFGLAKFLPTTSEQTLDTDAGALVGTVRYMAPEQLRGHPVDPAWDLWALTIMAYEMLTGAQPFAGSGVAALSGSFVPVNQHLPEAPERWQQFFKRGFALDEWQRPATARVFFSELKGTLS